MVYDNIGRKNLENNHLKQQIDSLVISNNNLHNELHAKGFNNDDIHKLGYDPKFDNQEEFKYINTRIEALKISGLIFGFIILFIIIGLVTTPCEKKCKLNEEKLE